MGSSPNFSSFAQNSHPLISSKINTTDILDSNSYEKNKAKNKNELDFDVNPKNSFNTKLENALNSKYENENTNTTNKKISINNIQKKHLNETIGSENKKYQTAKEKISKQIKNINQNEFINKNIVQTSQNQQTIKFMKSLEQDFDIHPEHFVDALICLDDKELLSPPSESVDLVIKKLNLPQDTLTELKSKYIKFLNQWESNHLNSNINSYTPDTLNESITSYIALSQYPKNEIAKSDLLQDISNTNIIDPNLLNQQSILKTFQNIQKQKATTSDQNINIEKISDNDQSLYPNDQTNRELALINLGAFLANANYQNISEANDIKNQIILNSQNILSNDPNQKTQDLINELANTQYNAINMNVNNSLSSPLQLSANSEIPTTLVASTAAIDKLINQTKKNAIYPEQKIALKDTIQTPTDFINANKENQLNIDSIHQSQINPLNELMPDQLNANSDINFHIHNDFLSLNPSLNDNQSKNKQDHLELKQNTKDNVSIAAKDIMKNDLIPLVNIKELQTFQNQDPNFNIVDSKAIAHNIKEVSQKIQMLNHQGGGQIQVSLEPEGLGKVLIKVSTVQGKLAVEMIAQESHARDLLGNNLSNLKLNLESQNIKIGEIKVNLGQTFHSDFGQHQQRNQQDTQQYQQHPQQQAYSQDLLQNFQRQNRNQQNEVVDSTELKINGKPSNQEGLELSINNKNRNRSNSKEKGLHLIA